MKTIFNPLLSQLQNANYTNKMYTGEINVSSRLYVPPSKLLTFVNKDSCFEGVPSLNTLLYEFKGISLVKGSKHYTEV